MKLLKRLFCSHSYNPKEGYANIGWLKCEKCGKEIYREEMTQFTKFRLGEFKIEIKNNNMINKNKNKKFITPVSKVFVRTLRKWRDEQNQNYENIKLFNEDTDKDFQKD